MSDDAPMEGGPPLVATPGAVTDTSPAAESAPVGRSLLGGAGRWLIAGVIVFAAGTFLYVRRGELSVLNSLKVADLVTLSVSTLGFFFVSGYVFTLVVNVVSIKLTLLETVALSFVTNFGNYFGPTRPGVALKAVYLKRVQELSYTRFSTLLAAYSLLVVFVSSVFGLGLLVLLWQATGELPVLLLAACALMGLASALPFFVPIPDMQRESSAWRFVNNAVKGFREIRTRRTLLLWVCLGILAQYVASALIYQILYAALGHPVSFLAALVIAVFTSLSNLVAVTPNNLGVQEVVTAYLSSVADIDFTTGLIGAAVLRAVHIITTFVGGPVFAYLLFRKSQVPMRALLRAQFLPEGEKIGLTGGPSDSEN
jgi:uncharacterized membrane protein YbhN (UPF0104 family)